MYMIMYVSLCFCSVCVYTLSHLPVAHTCTLQAEKKVEGIRNGCHVTTKKLTGTILGSGSSLEKHQVCHTHITMETNGHAN